MNSQAAPDGALGQSRDSDGNMITTVTWTATDSMGNSHTCHVVVSISDPENPVVSCEPFVHFATESEHDYGLVGESNGVQVAYPQMADNSGETLTVTTFVGSAVLPTDYQFPFVGSGRASEWQIEYHWSYVPNMDASQLPPEGLFGAAVAYLGDSMLAVGAPRAHYGDDPSAHSSCDQTNACPGSVYVHQSRNQEVTLGQIAEWCPSEFASCVNQGEGNDLSRPDDSAVPSSTNFPPDEAPSHAIDGDPSTKYLNFDQGGSGLTITTSSPGIVDQISLTSADDSPGRDPASFVLFGSSDGTTFEEIASGIVPTFQDRFQRQVLSFGNENTYQSYRLTFPTLADPETDAMQIAEVELLVSCHSEIRMAIASGGTVAVGSQEFLSVFQCVMPHRENNPSASMTTLGHGVGGLNLENGDRFGATVAAIGDINADGHPDLAVGAPGSDEGRGAVFILFLLEDGSVDSHIKICARCPRCGFLADLVDGAGFGSVVTAVQPTQTDQTRTELIVSVTRPVIYNSAWLLELDSRGVIARVTEIELVGATDAHRMSNWLSLPSLRSDVSIPTVNQPGPDGVSSVTSSRSTIAMGVPTAAAPHDEAGAMVLLDFECTEICTQDCTQTCRETCTETCTESCEKSCSLAMTGAAS
eukprot:COSAG06_NODE_9318_length_1930_cov_1.637357_1_plen_642_part_11